MKFKHYGAFTACAALGLFLTGCVDDKYDLSDIDTTSEFTVNNLVLPVNIDPIQMTSLIELKEDGIIKQIDGNYCVVEENTFTSSPIKINEVHLRSQNIVPQKKTFDITGAEALLELGQTLELDLSCNPSPYDMSCNDVPASIVSIEKIGGNIEVRISLALEGLGSNLKSFTLRNAKLQLPKGMTGVTGNGTYNPQTGIFSVNDTKINGSIAYMTITSSGLDFAQSGAIYNPSAATIKFNDNLSVKSATAVVTKNDIANISALPNQVSYSVNYVIKDMSVDTFTGNFKYDLDNLKIPSVNLSSLPDVLSQEGTDISLVNPQLYLTVENPLSGYGVHGSLNLDFIAKRADGDKHYNMDSPLTIEALREATYCMSPSQPESWANGYTNVIYHKFSSLGDVISGNGLPKELKIDVLNPSLPVQHVTDFKLGTELGSVNGSYYFYAPLELGAGSQIVYESVVDGWWDEDVNKLTIKELKVTTKVTSDAPISLDFSAYPIDREGKQIGNVEIEGGYVPANATDYELTIHITGEIKGLDGLRYKAVAATNDGENAATLNENMKITLSEIRATVSGNYTTDF